MRYTTLKPRKSRVNDHDLTGLRELILGEMQRLEARLQRIEDALQHEPVKRTVADGGRRQGKEAVTPRSSPLDNATSVRTATIDLRVTNGNLSAERICKLYGVSLSELATWLGRTKQALSKTPDADSLQDALEYFDRVARLRLVTENDAEFRKWLRTSDAALENQTPLGLLKAGHWQEMADKVDDILTGMPA